MVTQEELWALNVLTQTASNVQTELQRLIAARQSIIKLLEDKYEATFNEKMGQFTEK
jgi:hypothetical protein